MVAGAGATRRHAIPAADPLPLNLPAPSPFPGRIRPEGAVPCQEPFDHEDWRFSVDWDGSRALLFASPAGEMRVQNECLDDVTAQFPELQATAASLAGRQAVLDGVIGVLDPEGRPDLGALGRRLALGPAGGGSLPPVYLATDLLYLDGRPTMAWPLDRRLATLREVVERAELIQAPDHVESRGRALAEAAGARGLSGLLARRADAPYHPGIASPDRLRIALSDRTTCLVAALTNAAPGRGRGLILAEHERGRLVIAGWVPAPTERAVAGWLEQRARTLLTQAPALSAPPQGGSVRWLRPAITASVSHFGRHRDGTLRSPTLVAIREDCDPMWCVRRDPIPPPSVATGGGFVPTLLLPLPLDEAALSPVGPH